MVDFAALRDRQKAKAASTPRHPTVIHKPVLGLTVQQRRDNYFQIVYDLLEHMQDNLTEWEVTFCEDVYKVMKARPMYSPTDKQAAVLDKLADKWL